MSGYRMSRRAGLAIVAATTVAGFVAWSWPLARHLSTHTLVLDVAPSAAESARDGQPDWKLMLDNDQDLSLWGAGQNARALVHADWRALLAQGQCYPMPNASTLGEHMIELGILAAPWWILCGDPVVAFNLCFLTALLVGASGMFLFLHRHTRCASIAVAGAIAFAFATPRLVDLPHHPAVVGTHWIPWVLWSFDRVLDGNRRSAPVWLAITLLLSTLVGSYPLLAVALVGSAYGLTALAQRARRRTLEPASVLSCVAAVLPAFAVVATVLLAYVGVQHQWAIVANPGVRALAVTSDYLPTGRLSAGAMPLLGLVPLLLLRRKAGRDAVPGLVAATVVAFVLATRLALPDGSSWSLYDALAGRLALLDSVRAPGKAGLAVCFGLQALGAIGWSRCVEGRGPRTQRIIAASLVALTVMEVAPPSWARSVLGGGAAMQLREIAPARATIDALASSLGDARDRRPVLDLPQGRMVRAPLALVDAAYHGHPTSACYNSLVPPTLREVFALGARSHTERGVSELAAAGFGYVIERPSPSAPLSPESFPAPARLLAFEKDLAVWSLPHPGIVHQDISKLTLVATGGATRRAAFAPEPPHELDVDVTNRGSEMWSAPRPVRPLFADIELASADGRVVFRSRARGVLPLALAPAASETMRLVMAKPPPEGTWRATIHIDGAPQATAARDFRWTTERD